MKPELHLAIDIFDDFVENDCFYTQEQIQALMQEIAGLGATRVEWIVDPIWNYYEAYPGGFDLLAIAVDAAHAAGLVFYAVFKPFESCLNFNPLPAEWRDKLGGSVWQDLSGLHPIVWPFVTDHPECCLKRRPGGEDRDVAVGEIRLVKGDTKPCPFAPEQISIWTGEQNGCLSRYPGEFAVSESEAWRPFWRWQRISRILCLSQLHIPPDQRYIEVRVEAAQPGEFVNGVEALVELVGTDGQPLLTTPSLHMPYGRADWRQWQKPVYEQSVRLFQQVDGQALFADAEACDKRYAEMRAFGYKHTDGETLDLCQTGHVTVARGSEPRIPILNPIDPAARAHLLDVVRFCLERGVDGVNIRPSTHYKSHEWEAYGYNDATLHATGGSLNRAAVSRANGEAYTLFLRQAADLIHAQGARLAVHLLSSQLRPSDEDRLPPHPTTVDYEWEIWIREIADEAVFRGAFGFRPQHLAGILDRFALACSEAGKPLVYQSNRRIVHNVETFPALQAEMNAVAARSDIAAYQLYEAAYITRLNRHGLPEIKPAVKALFAG